MALIISNNIQVSLLVVLFKVYMCCVLTCPQSIFFDLSPLCSIPFKYMELGHTILIQLMTYQSLVPISSHLQNVISNISSNGKINAIFFQLIYGNARMRLISLHL